MTETELSAHSYVQRDAWDLGTHEHVCVCAHHSEIASACSSFAFAKIVSLLPLVKSLLLFLQVPFQADSMFYLIIKFCFFSTFCLIGVLFLF